MDGPGTPRCPQASKPTRRWPPRLRPTWNRYGRGGRGHDEPPCPNQISGIVKPANHSFSCLGEEVLHRPRSAGDALPRRCAVIEVRVAELRQLFNAIDPSPFRQRDLDPRAEEFIVDWARDLPTDKPWALVVHLDRPAGRPDEAAALREAIHEYFGQRVVAARRKLRELFRRGRISFVIALAFLTASIAVGDAVAGYFEESRIGGVIREGFLIGGWVAMWRPLEVFLYDWWPIRAEGRLLQRLSTMPVRIEYREAAPADAWRSDWPAVAAAEVPRRAPIEAGARDTVMNT